jgi:chromosome segregation ATPase
MAAVWEYTYEPPDTLVRIAELEMELKALDDENERLMHENNSQAGRIQELEDIVGASDDNIAELENDIGNRDAEIWALEGDVERLEARVKELKEYETPCYKARDKLLTVVNDIREWQLWGWDDRLRRALDGVDTALGILEEV